MTIESVGIIVRGFGSGSGYRFDGDEIATSAFGLLAMTGCGVRGAGGWA